MTSRSIFGAILILAGTLAGYLFHSNHVSRKAQAVKVSAKN